MDGEEAHNPPLVVVVMGVAGCGKTTVASRLAERLGCAFQEGDALHPPENVARMSAGTPLTDADRDGRDLVRSWMIDLGLDVTVDAVGNMIGTWNVGKSAPVMTGSHIDTVRTGGKYDGLVQTGASLLSLKYSRSDETDADLVGLDIAARAGYDPRAGISLWKKMSAASKGAPPQFMSTHPSGPNRIKEIEAHLKEALPLYERAEKPKPWLPPVARATPPPP